MFSGADCLAGSRSPMHGRYWQDADGEKMMFGSPRSATSVLLDKTTRVVDPAVGLGIVGKLDTGALAVVPVRLLRLLGRVAGSGLQLGSWTGTESGNFSVSHRKYREAQGRVGSELECEIL